MIPTNLTSGFQPPLFDQPTPTFMPNLGADGVQRPVTDDTAVKALAIAAGVALAAYAWSLLPTLQQTRRFLRELTTLPATMNAMVGTPSAISRAALRALGGPNTRPAAAPAPAAALAAPSNIQPAPPAATGVAPAPQPAEILAQQARDATARFTAAADNFVRDMDLTTITPAAYSTFIHSQTITNHQVPLAQMHTIVGQRFVALRNEHVPAFMTTMHDETTLQAQIEQAAAFAEERRAALLARDAALAGGSRFDGEINAAWENLFNGAKSYTEALAKLCHFVAHSQASLTAHESYMLSQLHPKHPDGKNELIAMQTGVKEMAFGPGAINNQTILSNAAALEGSEDVVENFLQATRNVAARQAAYIQLHREREEITGPGVNPQEETAAIAADSSLAQVAGFVPAAQAARNAALAQRAAQIALVQRFQQGTLDQIYVAPSQNIGGV